MLIDWTIKGIQVYTKQFYFRIMMLILFQIVALIAVMIAPLSGPKTKKKELEKKLSIDTDVSNAHYAIDPNGFLVEIHGKELSKNEL